MENKLVDLVNRWHAFEQTHPHATITDFCRQQIAVAEHKPTLPRESDSEKKLTIETLLMRSVGRVMRFHSSYTRKTLAELNFKNLDDFLYLNILSQLKNPKKSELIYASVSEFSSGTEIIRRLIRMGLMKESDDKNDRRSKRLTITSKGESVLQKCYKKMTDINVMVYEKMDAQDKELMYTMFKQLDDFHTAVYLKTKNKDIKEIREVIRNS